MNQTFDTQDKYEFEVEEAERAYRRDPSDVNRQRLQDAYDWANTEDWDRMI